MGFVDWVAQVIYIAGTHSPLELMPHERRSLLSRNRVIMMLSIEQNI
jgi:hypothetical protein